jgi:hypothetical protein
VTTPSPNTPAANKPNTDRPLSERYAHGGALDEALTPVASALVGFGLDWVFGTLPIFTTLLVIMSAISFFVRAWVRSRDDIANAMNELPFGSQEMADQ